MLQKKTNLGTLTSRYKQDEEYPGFWIDLRQKNGDLVPVCNIEYNSFTNCIQVVVYGDKNLDEPTNIIEIENLNCGFGLE